MRVRWLEKLVKQRNNALERKVVKRNRLNFRFIQSGEGKIDKREKRESWQIIFFHTMYMALF